MAQLFDHVTSCIFLLAHSYTRISDALFPPLSFKMLKVGLPGESIYIRIYYVLSKKRSAEIV